jgi:hypothetical protein
VVIRDGGWVSTQGVVGVDEEEALLRSEPKRPHDADG